MNTRTSASRFPGTTVPSASAGPLTSGCRTGLCAFVPIFVGSPDFIVKLTKPGCRFDELAIEYRGVRKDCPLIISKWVPGAQNILKCHRAGKNVGPLGVPEIKEMHNLFRHHGYMDYPLLVKIFISVAQLGEERTGPLRAVNDDIL
jgi:hypothetical protein